MACEKSTVLPEWRIGENHFNNKSIGCFVSASSCFWRLSVMSLWRKWNHSKSFLAKIITRTKIIVSQIVSDK